MIVFLCGALLAADAVTINTKPHAMAPDKPSVTIVVHQLIAGAQLELKRDDGTVVHFPVPKASSGKFLVELDQPLGRPFEYNGELTVSFADGESGVIPLHFSADIQSSLKVDTWATAEDVHNHHFWARLSATAGRVDMTLLGEGGVALGKHTVNFKHEAGGTPILVDWGMFTTVPLRIDATFYDDKGAPQSLQLFPWYTEIAHDDVNFASGKYDIPKSEEQKLLAVVPKIREAAAKARGYVAVRLYVLGHTDTVGTDEDNLRLSRLRARSLVVFLHGHGVDLPATYSGAGETMLAVATPDNTDNAKNRRAQYVLSVTPPPMPKAVDWQDY